MRARTKSLGCFATMSLRIVPMTLRQYSAAVPFFTSDAGTYAAKNVAPTLPDFSRGRSVLPFGAGLVMS